MNDVIGSLVFGFTLAISVGPIALLIIQNGIVGGFKASGRSALGAALGDFSYALLAFLVGGALVATLAKHSAEIKILSSLVLLSFGIYLGAAAFFVRTPREGQPKLVGLRGTFVLTVLNPMTIIAFVAFLGQSSSEGNLFQLLRMSFAVFVGSLAAQLLFALGAATLKPYLDDGRIVTGIRVLSGVGVAGFAVMGLLR